jgi:hypothetical protein
VDREPVTWKSPTIHAPRPKLVINLINFGWSCGSVLAVNRQLFIFIYSLRPINSPKTVYVWFSLSSWICAKGEIIRNHGKPASVTRNHLCCTGTFIYRPKTKYNSTWFPPLVSGIPVNYLSHCNNCRRDSGSGNLWSAYKWSTLLEGCGVVFHLRSNAKSGTSISSWPYTIIKFPGQLHIHSLVTHTSTGYIHIHLHREHTHTST